MVAPAFDGLYTRSLNRVIATSAERVIQSMVMTFTIRCTVIYIKCIIWECIVASLTVGTENLIHVNTITSSLNAQIYLTAKTSPMPLALQFTVHGRYSFLFHWKPAGTAFWKEQLFKVFFAENLALMFNHAGIFLINYLLAICTVQMTSMVVLAQCLNAFLV
jgi:hypothetical protein